MSTRLSSATDSVFIRDHMLGRNAQVTLHSLRTGRRITYKSTLILELDYLAKEQNWGAGYSFPVEHSWSLQIMRLISISVMAVAADQKLLKPNIGSALRLIA